MEPVSFRRGKLYKVEGLGAEDECEGCLYQRNDECPNNYRPLSGPMPKLHGMCHYTQHIYIKRTNKAVAEYVNIRLEGKQNAL